MGHEVSEASIEAREAMTGSKAKAIIQEVLAKAGISFHRMTSKRWDFSGLGYGSSITVTVWGWKQNYELYGQLKQLAREHHFSLDVTTNLA